MNGAQLHLLINHLPVLLPPLGAVLIALGLGLKAKHLIETGLWILLLGTLTSVPVYLTGEPAEAVVKNYPGISRNLIQDHEDAAVYALAMNLVAAVWACGMVYAFRTGKKLAQSGASYVALLLWALIAFASVARTAHLGGFIRHEEIRSGDRF